MCVSEHAAVVHCPQVCTGTLLSVAVLPFDFVVGVLRLKNPGLN